MIFIPADVKKAKFFKRRNFQVMTQTSRHCVHNTQQLQIIHTAYDAIFFIYNVFGYPRSEMDETLQFAFLNESHQC